MCPSSQQGRRSARALFALLVPALLVVGLPTSAEAAPDLSVGQPVLDLEFEGDLVDSAATPHPVTANGAAPSYVEGTVTGTQALRFAGGTYLDLGKRVDLQPSNLSYSFWLKPNGAMQGEELITWNKEAYNSDGWYLSSEGNDSPLAISIGPASNQPYKVAVASTDRASFFPADTWTHVVVSFDTSTKQVRFYRNGLPVKTRVAAAVGGDATGTITGSESIRKTMGHNGPYNGAYLDGALDHVELFDGVVTNTDVAKLYEAGGGQLNREALGRADSEAISLPTTATLAVALPSEGGNGSRITWTSSDPAVISPTGKVTPPAPGDDDVEVTLTSATQFADGPVIERSFQVVVTAPTVPLADSGLAGVDVTDDYIVNATLQEQKYLLELSSKKFLYWNYRTAGLQPPTSSGYGGWEDGNVGGNFRGHAFGHYMSALAMAYSSTEDATTKAALHQQILDAVNGLAEVQATYKGTSKEGYLAPFRESALDAVEGRGNSDDPVIVPYYNLHKILAGLLAIKQYVGGTEGAKALDVARAFGEYLYRRVSTLPNKDRLLATEYGGMNDALYSLYEMSGDANPHFKIAAEGFDETSLFRELAAGRDVLPGRHANTTIPKLIGALKRYTLFTQNPSLYAKLTDAEKADLPMYLAAAQNFFRIVKDDHTYATGANSQSEHFHGPDTLYQFATTRGEAGNAETAETCNEYNMLKLARELFKITYDKQYADFYENTFINTILSSQNPDTGMVTYFQAMAPGYNKLYSMPFTDFWCCLGTGIESFAKLGDSIYYRGAGTVWVNMFFSSTFQDPSSGLAITQAADLPNSPTVNLAVTPGTGTGGTGTTGLRLRVPDWIDGSPTVAVNGTTITPRITGGYVVLTGLEAGDTIAYTMPMTVKAMTTEDNKAFAAFKYGPVLLSAGLGTKGIDRSYPVGIGVRVSARDNDAQQTVVIDSTSVSAWLADAAKNLVKIDDTADGQVQFALRNTLDGDKLRFTPHYRRHDERYGLYMTYEVRDSEASQQRIRDAKQRDRVAAFTTDSLMTFDNNNFENAKGLKTTGTSSVGLWQGQNYRDAQAGGSFSYDLAVDPSQPATLGVRYFSGDAGRSFDVYVDDTRLKTERQNTQAGQNVFYWQEDALPAAATADGKVTVRFQSTGGLVGGVFGVRTMRPLVYDTDPALSKLTSDVGTLAPAFTPATTSYTLYVPTGTTQTALDLDPHLSTGLVTVDGALVDDTQPRTVDLTPGTAKQLSIVSYAQDHTTKRAYTLRVVEGTAPVETGNGTGQPGTTDPGTTGPTTGQAPAVQVEATTTTVKAPKTVRPGRKVQLVVAVAGGAPGAPVQITEKGKVIATVTLGADGTAKVKVRLKGKKTRHALLVTYLGTSTTATSADTVTVKVKSPRR